MANQGSNEVQGKRIAIYGGTFDPVHCGHLEVARTVCPVFEINETFFVPAHRAPHKLTRAVTSAFHRYAMLVLATKDDPNLLVSTFELDSPDRPYTVDTLTYFKERFEPAADLFFVMGADSWSELTSWRQWERLLEMANHIVVTRPGYDTTNETVAAQAGEHLLDLRGMSGAEIAQAVNTASGRTVFITDLVNVDVSATKIRSAARNNQFEELRKFVPVTVAEYIDKYQIYREFS